MTEKSRAYSPRRAPTVFNKRKQKRSGSLGPARKSLTKEDRALNPGEGGLGSGGKSEERNAAKNC